MSDSASSFIPPATFEFLVASLQFQAEMNMGTGMKPDEEGEDNGPNLPLARHFIDILGMLQEKTKGNLSMEEKRLLENALTELRFRYVQAFDRATQKAAPKPGDSTTA
ncbi:MAG: DUF1844 domain-containing protein [Bryobacterales bacterium]|nr:DUF1844 domain-containing protein [Bryobacterales bacterium]